MATEGQRPFSFGSFPMPREGKDLDKKTQAPAQVRKSFEMKHRRNEIALLYLQGHTQTAIANQLGLTKQMVNRDIKALRDEYNEQSNLSTSEYQAAEIKRLEALEFEALRAWNESRGQKVVIKRRLPRTNKAGFPTQDEQPYVQDDGHVYEQTVSESPGDPRFISELRSIIERRCRLLGLDTQQQVSAGELGRVAGKSHEDAARMLLECAEQMQGEIQAKHREETGEDLIIDAKVSEGE